MKKLVELFFIMLKIGLFTFGGGYAMLALLENEYVLKREWMTKDEFLDMAAIAESTPGPIAINSATYIGYKKYGVIGSIVATLGICIPSFVIIYLVSLFFDEFLSFKIVEHAFRGIQVCVIYLIFSAGIKMFKGMKKSVMNTVVSLICGVCMITLSLFAVKFSTIYYVLIFGALGIIVHLLSRLRREKNK